MAKRHGQSLWVLPELWIKVKEYCSLRCLSLSPEVERYCTELLMQDWEVPYHANRQITSYILKKTFAREFPLERKRISLNLAITGKLLEIAKAKLYIKYGTDQSLSKSDVVMMVLYMYSKEKGIPLQQESFFNDQYFEQNFVLRVDKVYVKISGLHCELGRLPTSREYAVAGGDTSLSYLKSCFGSYSKALDSYLGFISRKADS